LALLLQLRRQIEVGLQLRWIHCQGTLPAFNRLLRVPRLVGQDSVVDEEIDVLRNIAQSGPRQLIRLAGSLLLDQKPEQTVARHRVFRIRLQRLPPGGDRLRSVPSLQLLTPKLRL